MKNKDYVFSSLGLLCKFSIYSEIDKSKLYEM